MITSRAQNLPPRHVREKTSGVFVLFSREYSFHLCCLGNLFATKFAIFILEQGLVVKFVCLMTSCVRAIRTKGKFETTGFEVANDK